MARLFDAYVIADWTAAEGKKLGEGSLWIGVAKRDVRFRLYTETHNVATRAEGEALLASILADHRKRGDRVLVGLDFNFGYPAGTAARLGLDGTPWQAMWKFIASNIVDKADNTNNRFAVAARINAAFPEGDGPFWSHPSNQHWPGLPAKKAGIDYAALGIAEQRVAEGAAKGAKSPFMLFNPGSVGSQSLLGLPMIHRLASGPEVAVWPFDDIADATVVLAEVYPSLIAGPVAIEANRLTQPADQAQVRLLSRALWRLGQVGRLAGLLKVPTEAATEGWILGANDPALLAEALQWSP